MRQGFLFAAVLLLGLFTGVVRAHEGDHEGVDFAHAFAEPIENKHGNAAWRSHEAIQYDIKITFGGNVVFEGTTIFEIAAERVRMTSKDGNLTMVWDGKDAWYSPADAKVAPPPRFHLRTWTYFLAVPFKLRDPGTTLSPMNDAQLTEAAHKNYDRAKLTFGENVGDAPDDWYVIYRDKRSNQLEAMAYIVTYSKRREKAEEKPSIILYRGYERVDGVLLSTDWSFAYWSADKGVIGKPKGDVKLSNLKFIKLEPGTFDKPEGAKLDPLPGA